MIGFHAIRFVRSDDGPVRRPVRPIEVLVWLTSSRPVRVAPCHAMPCHAAAPGGEQVQVQHLSWRVPPYRYIDCARRAGREGEGGHQNVEGLR